MLDFVGLPQIGHRIDLALRKVLREAKSTTPDLGGKATTDEMCAAVIAGL
jgi:isocitrate/isopropylmalate dehydrogenase